MERSRLPSFLSRIISYSLFEEALDSVVDFSEALIAASKLDGVSIDA